MSDNLSRDTHGVTVIVVGNKIGDTSSNLDEAVCDSLRANALGKGMNPTVLPSGTGKY